ncbi:MAG TPA: CpsB/CapC family capsule biosynthesis tyrosine phosphatase, partial [Chitinophagaceae bacterium]|nr:CpsB/CapC family capsule biosynthesis tyrosine phosphatase [Chitinophagaceae bacterium]
DDGSPDMENSIELVKFMTALGYKKIITTPHIMSDMYPNDRDTILQKLDELRTAVKSAGIETEIYAAAEYFLDDHVAGLLKNNEPLLTISGNMVLVEFSLANQPMILKEIIYEMQMRGYQPVIAHPERYQYLEYDKPFYEDLKDLGCLFQLNILSLGNYYGKSAHKLANYLIKKEYYDLVGTDLHHPRHAEALNDPSLAGPLWKLLETGKIRNSQL